MGHLCYNCENAYTNILYLMDYRCRVKGEANFQGKSRILGKNWTSYTCNTLTIALSVETQLLKLQFSNMHQCFTIVKGRVSDFYVRTPRNICFYLNERRNQLRWPQPFCQSGQTLAFKPMLHLYALWRCSFEGNTEEMGLYLFRLWVKLKSLTRPLTVCN